MSLPLTEYDCGKLGPVSPLSQHGHGEGLDEYLAQEAEHCGRGTAVTATQFETAATAALLLLLAIPTTAEATTIYDASLHANFLSFSTAAANEIRDFG